MLNLSIDRVVFWLHCFVKVDCADCTASFYESLFFSDTFTSSYLKQCAAEALLTTVNNWQLRIFKSPRVPSD